ncbi:MAG: hypothetical protein ACI8QZ_001355 [Chlamydiales bacterium]|jgi:hypothetical protein
MQWALSILPAAGLGATARAQAQVPVPVEHTVPIDPSERAPFSAPDGSIEYERPSAPCLTSTQRLQIRRAVASNQRMLIASGAFVRSPSHLVRFGWPLNAVGSAAEGFGYHAISGFMDHDLTFPGNLLDYDCGTRTYDGSAGNHKGTDIFGWPYYWTWMHSDELQAVAAAPGIIMLTADGNFDENCANMGGVQWNGVIIQHLDGSVAWYGHLKAGSLTTKVIGDRVVMGEYLGVLGSSGNSNGPHLHFEVYDQHDQRVDPFAGPCNTLNARSWWLQQRPYYDSAINRLLIGNAPVSRPPCPGDLVTNEVSSIPRGTNGVFTTFYRDQLGTQTSTYRILRPGGTVYSSWTHTSTVPHHTVSGPYWTRSIPPGAPTGTWTFEVTFDGLVYSKTFQVI